MATTKATTLAHTLASTTSSTADLDYAKTLNDTGVTSTEFDKLDGLTATTDELNLVDGSVTGPLSNRNIIINGAMQVWQRSSSSKLCYDNNNEGYSNVDRFSMQFGSGAGQSGNGRITTSQETSVLPDIAGGDKFSKALKIVCSVEETPSSSKESSLSYRVEGQDMQRFGWGQTNAKPAVLSFYFKTSVVGIYSVSLTHYGTGTRRRMISFNVADTNWNRYQIPISADTVAVPDTINLGLNIQFYFMNVPNYEYTGGTDSGWGTAIKLTDDDQVNFLSSASNTLYITGLQLELGSVATPFEHRSYAEELARCQRYYYKIDTFRNNGYGSLLMMTSHNDTQMRGHIELPQVMRTLPDFVPDGNFQTVLNVGGTLLHSDFAVADTGGNPSYQIRYDAPSGTPFTEGKAYMVRGKNDIDAYFEFKAEL